MIDRSLPQQKAALEDSENQFSAEVVVMEPRGFAEMPQVIQLLWERKSVLLNLTMMNPYEAQRAVDFVAGGTYAIDGHQKRVGEMVFLFTPICVQVNNQVATARVQIASNPSHE